MTLFADVSEFQVPVDDSYPYEVLSIRACDGTYQDHHFAQNYQWMCQALDSGKLSAGIVYTYVRPAEWHSNAQTALNMVQGAGGMHPGCVWMLDVESGGNPSGDQSVQINQLHDTLAQTAPVIGYGNVYDLETMWPNRPSIPLIIADYGSTAKYPGMIAQQYTDGTGYGSGPQGCAPFGNCDMNSSDLSIDDFVDALGIGMAFSKNEQQELLDKVRYIFDQLQPWPQLGQNAQGENLTLVDAVADVLKKVSTPAFINRGTVRGNPHTPLKMAPEVLHRPSRDAVRGNPHAGEAPVAGLYDRRDGVRANPHPTEIKPSPFKYRDAVRGNPHPQV